MTEPVRSIESRRLHELIAEIRFPLDVSVTYDVPGETIGLRLHARDCAKALKALAELEALLAEVGGLLPAPAEPPDLGLSIDMLDVDRLRKLADNIEAHGADLTQWAYPQFICEWLRGFADRLDTAVRDIGKLRGSLPAQAPHRCLGCGHRWDVPTGFILNGAELCGDCWRKAQPILHGGLLPAPAKRPGDDASREAAKRMSVRGPSPACLVCGGLPPGEASGAGDLCYCLPAQAPRGETKCWHGHTYRVVGCVSCCLVFRADLEGSRKDTP